MKYIFYAIWMLWDVYVMRRPHCKTVPIKGFKAEHRVVKFEDYKNYCLFLPGYMVKYAKWFPLLPAANIVVTERDELGNAKNWEWEAGAPKEPAWYLNFVRKHLKK